MVTLNLKVSRNDIKNGVESDSTECPIARLFNRVIGKGLKADVENTHVDVTNDDYDEEGNPTVSASFKLPKSVSKFISDFDNGNNPKPLSFSVRLSNNTAKALNIRKKYLAVVA